MKTLIVAALAVVTLACAVQASPVEDAQKLESGTECLICEFLTKELDQYLEQPDTEKKIVGALEDVCKFVPSNLDTACKGFIEANGDAIVNWIVGELSEQNVCDEILDLGCDTDIITQITKGAAGDAPSVSGTTCDICHDVISALKQALDSPSTISSITSDVEELCTHLGALKGLCNDLIDKWVPEVINWLDGKLDPTTVCKDIHVCSATVGGKLNLGTNPCSFGPSYWCEKRENADECGEHTVAFCLETFGGFHAEQ